MLRLEFIVPAVLGAVLSLPVEASDTPGPSFPFHSKVLHDVAPDGALLAAGTHHKARADAGGFTFTPYFGSDAPRNFPVRFRVRSLTTNGVAQSAPDVASVARSGDVMCIDRGVVESRYTLGPRMVEQAFTIPSPGAGEVRLALDVASDLEIVAEGNGLRFVGEHGYVSYGAATAFAPDGRSAPVATVVTGKGLELVVPAEFVATCDGPLLIDPFIGSGTVTVPTVPWTEVASDVGADRDIGYVIVVEREFSATDHDIFAY